jgi:hypothetical protein
MRYIVIICIAMGMAACLATSFTGDAKIPQGPTGCQAICSGWDMEMAGMVAMGEYSTACLCTVPGKADRAALVSGVGPAVVGVINQMRAAEEERRRRSSSSSPSPGPGR